MCSTARDACSATPAASVAASVTADDTAGDDTTGGVTDVAADAIADAALTAAFPVCSATVYVTCGTLFAPKLNKLSSDSNDIGQHNLNAAAIHNAYENFFGALRKKILIIRSAAMT